MSKLYIQMSIINMHVQVVELIDASAVNASAVRLDWMLHVSTNEKFVEVSYSLQSNVGRELN